MDKSFSWGFSQAMQFPLVSALLGRRSRRFFQGAEIPDGFFAHASKREPLPLSDEERMTLLTAMSGTTGWHNMIHRGEPYAPQLPNYAGAAAGRSFPSAAGFHTLNLFFTDDSGLYLLENRDAPATVPRGDSGLFNPERLVRETSSRVRKLSDTRLSVPDTAAEAHNTWVFNKPGTFLAIPVTDLAQHGLLNLCYLTLNRLCIYDDEKNAPIPGMDRFADMVDLDNPLPLRFVEQLGMNEATVEIASCCYAGVLMLQAMGLGGWMFNGADWFAVMGASGDPDRPGLGFDFQEDPRWGVPHVTGKKGVFECFCPPNYPDMRAAVEAVAERKFGPGGPFHPDTPGPWKDSRGVRSSARPHDERFKECVTLQAEYIFGKYGKFPGTTPAAHCLMYLQAMHLDLDFYDRFYEPGAYLETHRRHMEMWHPERGE